ncbi:P-loop NTPase family protein [Campylobacter estrildidarum]|uniref:ATP-binding protein n=1 Tax=Campylobacter estrildidarum TaxID=2510189 RepID=A0A4U7BML6_9BACT|nr:ATP-binding protein [Campylobacter estrildidarum]TKX31440.1 ATP-binding protein [Campylobacter estrildidarum]
MNKIVNLREEIFSRINESLKHKTLILICGLSGSGKSVLLQRLAKYHDIDYIDEIFSDEKEFKDIVKKRKKDVLILDEVGMYEIKILELIRIYSDQMSFVLSSHKKIDLFEKDYFKSRFETIFWLEKLNTRELHQYIQLKFNINFSNKAMKIIMKFYKGNLRHVDKMLKSFCELNVYFKNTKSQDYVLKLCALENGFLK